MVLSIKNTLAFICISLFISSSIAESQNCKCDESLSIEQAYENSSIIFIGRVESRKRSGRRTGYDEVKFRVIPNRRFKGFEDLPASESLLVHTPAKPVDCGIDFAVGFEYLVYATGNPALLKARSCGRTSVLEKSMEDQETLFRLTDIEK